MNYFVMQDTDYFKIELNSIFLLTTPVHCKCSIYMYMYQASHKNYKHKDFLTIQLNVLNASELHVPVFYFFTWILFHLSIVRKWRFYLSSQSRRTKGNYENKEMNLVYWAEGFFFERNKIIYLSDYHWFRLWL